VLAPVRGLGAAARTRAGESARLTMAASAPGVAEAFRRLQAGDVAGALECAQRAAAQEPANARAHLARGIALRMAGRYDDASEALAHAQSLDPRDHAAAYETGIVRQLEGRIDDALGHFVRAAELRPRFFAAHFSAGLIHADRGEWRLAADRFRAVLAAQPNQPDAMLHLALALDRDGRHDEAEATFVHALAANPHHVPTLRVFGQHSAGRGNFRRAASLFAEVARLDPRDEAVPMFVAQTELLLGRWQPAWAAYARRVPRREFERECAARAKPYVVPTVESLAAGEATLVAEQGLGDTLFFLRWAPLLCSAGTRLGFAGDVRLHSMLARTRLFDTLEDAGGAARARTPILVGDLPSMYASTDPLTVPSLAFEPLPERVAKWEAALRGVGPRPWIGVQWRAGTPRELVAHALSKSVPVEALFAALAPAPGTVVALQRLVAPGELERASGALGRPVADLSRANDQLEDLLALTSLLDRHVAVSSTTLHIAAAAGATADVLVPFPPEWRWRLDGDSPWFPGFRVHRQGVDGDWAAALASIAAPH
jgi:tetratricopeptide (TPR) repeat protein